MNCYYTSLHSVLFCRTSAKLTNSFIRTASNAAIVDGIPASEENDDGKLNKSARRRSVMRTETTQLAQEFRKLNINRQKADAVFKRAKGREKKHWPRYLKMSTNQDWTNVWPTAQTFKWSVVPFPVRQGAIKVPSEGPGDGSPPLKYANAELMKIPNFLHLTPPHIAKHCKAIKKFCTAWPEGLETDEDCQKHFPVTTITSDYCFSSPNIKDTRARVVTVKFKLSDLGFDHHAKDKFLRLVGSRYDKATDTVTIITDRCPLKKQNYDYAMYLLTVLYFESWNRETWEDEKTLADMEQYYWDLNPSKQNIVSILQRIQEVDKTSTDMPGVKQLTYLPDEINEENIMDIKPVEQYKQSVEKLINLGETPENMEDYKRSVMELLNIKVAAKSS